MSPDGFDRHGAGATLRAILLHFFRPPHLIAAVVLRLVIAASASAPAPQVVQIGSHPRRSLRRVFKFLLLLLLLLRGILRAIVVVVFQVDFVVVPGGSIGFRGGAAPGEVLQGRRQFDSGRDGPRIREEDGEGEDNLAPDPVSAAFDVDVGGARPRPRPKKVPRLRGTPPAAFPSFAAAAAVVQPEERTGSDAHVERTGPPGLEGRQLRTQVGESSSDGSDQQDLDLAPAPAARRRRRSRHLDDNRYATYYVV
mmetsp:Transcript_39996/g.120535  ORF Transcript_39996/g.120535 Transcript_39996/m.120535 type:complete len:253 (-) Transcript_39996:22-780(-)